MGMSMQSVSSTPATSTVSALQQMQQMQQMQSLQQPPVQQPNPIPSKPVGPLGNNIDVKA